MKIYLAAQYSWRDQLKIYAKQLEQLGHEVVSTWLRERKDAAIDLNDCSDRFLKEHAQIDFDDVQEADCIISFTIDPTTTSKRGGRHVEFGLGYAQGKKMILCGPRENIFHYLDNVIQCDTFDDVIKYLEKNRG